MFTPIHLSSLVPSAYFTPQSFLDFLSSELTARIKQIAISTFTRISEFFTSYQKQSNEGNLKTFALISCLSLIGLLVISMLRRPDSRIVLPPTPEKQI